MKRRRLNNKGFSLVEVIVAVVIVALVATPILGSFATSSKVNAKAKILQDATDVAQYVAELIKAQSVADLSASIDPNNVGIWSGTIGDKDDGSGNRYIEGASGEKFYVTFQLNSEKYSAVSGATNTVNDSKKPQITNLYSGKNIVVLGDFTEFDTTMKADGYTQKETNINITVTNVPSSPGVFSYDVDLEMKFIKASSTVTKTKALGTYEIDVDAADEVLPNIYLLYSSYCTNGGASGKSTDVIHINYKPSASYMYMGELKVPVNVYFVWQNVADEYYGALGGHYMGFNPDNITVVNPGTFNSYIASEVALYSNVATTVSSKPITDSDENNISIYELIVTVRKDSPTGDIITTFTTTKEE